jgi:GTP cyclohydrolase I
LSKYASLAEWIMGRPQIQEEAVVQLADLIQEKTQPDGLAIVMEASHYCMAWRGVKDMDSKNDQFGHAWGVPERSQFAP